MLLYPTFGKETPNNWILKLGDFLSLYNSLVVRGHFIATINKRYSGLINLIQLTFFQKIKKGFIWVLHRGFMLTEKLSSYFNLLLKLRRKEFSANVQSIFPIEVLSWNSSNSSNISSLHLRIPARTLTWDVYFTKEMIIFIRGLNCITRLPSANPL